MTAAVSATLPVKPPAGFTVMPEVFAVVPPGVTVTAVPLIVKLGFTAAVTVTVVDPVRAVVGGGTGCIRCIVDRQTCPLPSCQRTCRNADRRTSTVKSRCARDVASTRERRRTGGRRVAASSADSNRHRQGCAVVMLDSDGVTETIGVVLPIPVPPNVMLCVV